MGTSRYYVRCIMKSNVEKAIILIFMVAVIFSGAAVFRTPRYIRESYHNIREITSDMPLTRMIKKTTKAVRGIDDKVSEKEIFTEMSGYFFKQIDLRDVYKDDSGFIMENGYIVRAYPPVPLKYEIKQMKKLKKFLDKRGIQLLYVNQPTKYIDDYATVKDIGLRSYINSNADRFLVMLRKAGINAIDYRDVMDRSDPYSYFYKTDHHWTVPAGKLAAEMIAGELNKNYGYDIDMSLYKDSRWNSKFFEQTWLGEQGRKLGSSFAGRDDFVKLWPKYDTSFTVTKDGETKTGSFDEVLIDNSYYLPENNKNIHEALSWHYSYKGNARKIVNNKCRSGKKVLVLGDSYEAVSNTFLALGVSELQGIVPRDYHGRPMKHIKENDYDTVIVAYTAFMLGSHEYKNANYKMFVF